MCVCAHEYVYKKKWMVNIYNYYVSQMEHFSGQVLIIFPAHIFVKIGFRKIKVTPFVYEFDEKEFVQSISKRIQFFIVKL